MCEPGYHFVEIYSVFERGSVFYGILTTSFSHVVAHGQSPASLLLVYTKYQYSQILVFFRFFLTLFLGLPLSAEQILARER